MKLKIKTDGRSVDINGYLDNDWCNFIFFIFDLFCCSNDLYWYLSPIQNRRNPNCSFDDDTRVGLEKVSRKMIFRKISKPKKNFSRGQHYSMGLIIYWIQLIRTVLYILTQSMSQITNFGQNQIILISTKKRIKKYLRTWETHSTVMSLHLYFFVWKHSNCAQETAI